MTDNNDSYERDHDLEQPLLQNDQDDTNQEISMDTASYDSSFTASGDELPTISRIITLIKPECGPLLFGMLLMFYNQTSSLFIPLLIGRAYDLFVDSSDSADSDEDGGIMYSVNKIMITVLALHLSGSFCMSFRISIMSIAGERIIARLRTETYSAILQQDIGFFDATKSGALVSRLGSDTLVIKEAVSNSWALIFISCFRILLSVALMFFLSPKLAGMSFASIVFIFILCLPFGRALGRLAKDYQKALGEAQNYPTETIGAMRTVKAFNAEKRERDRYAEKIGAPTYCPPRDIMTTFRIGYDQAICNGFFLLLVYGGALGAMYGSLWYGFLLVKEGELSVGTLSAFQSYIFGIGIQLSSVSSSFSNLVAGRYASQRIFGILDREPKINCNNDDNTSTTRNTSTSLTSTSEVGNSSKKSSTESLPKGNKKVQGSLSFENVSFSYPTRPDVTVLQNFTLNIPRGKTTAFVGPSGSGKSTSIALLERFYDVNYGCIRYDGVDIREMNLKDLRRHIGYVPQEPILFGLSIRENLRFGLDDSNEDITDEDLLNACRKANAYDFVTSLPNGLDERAGERGAKLSGGQKQRLAIARAILLNPDILLLDEATSALDAESEHQVQKAIDAASEGRTVIVVAHRLSTIKKADQIVVMEKGTLQDTGTHEELIRRCDAYKNLVARQSINTASTWSL